MTALPSEQSPAATVLAASNLVDDWARREEGEPGWSEPLGADALRLLSDLLKDAADEMRDVVTSEDDVLTYAIWTSAYRLAQHLLAPATAETGASS